jgi:type IV secretion system protein VirB4
MPLSSVWAGPERASRPAAAALAQTSGSTPFRLSTHVGDVGHMLIVGPTGAGKSVLLALIALQFRRYARRRSISSTRASRRAPPCWPWAASHHGLGADGGGGRMRWRSSPCADRRCR